MSDTTQKKRAQRKRQRRRLSARLGFAERRLASIPSAAAIEAAREALRDAIGFAQMTGLPGPEPTEFIKRMRAARALLEQKP